MMFYHFDRRHDAGQSQTKRILVGQAVEMLPPLTAGGAGNQHYRNEPPTK
jgi:hypothetical protein